MTDQRFTPGPNSIENEFRQMLLSRLSDYAVLFPDEQNTTRAFIQFVAGSVHCFHRSNLYGHVTGSVWLLSPDRHHVLLTHHKKLNTWVQPGGHADGDGCISRVALTEVHEESGISKIELLSESIFDIDIHPIPRIGDVPEHLHFDVRYLCVAGNTRYVVSEESHDLAWAPITGISEFTGDASVIRMADKWLRRVASARNQ